MHKNNLDSNHFDTNLLNKNIVANNDDFIIVFDEKGNTLEFNNAAQNTFGYSRNEALSKNETAFFKRKTAVNEIKKAIKKEKGYKGLVEFVNKQNKSFINLITAFQIRGNSLSEICYVVCGKDVERLDRISKKVRNTEKIYKDLFEKSTDIIQVVDLKGKFIHVNKAWLKTFGYTQKQSKNISIKNVIGNKNNYYKNDDFILNTLKDKSNKLKVVVFKDNLGNEIILEGISSIDYHKGNPNAIRSIFRNITEVRKAQEKLKVHSTRLNAVFNNSTHLFWIVDKRICLTAFNKNFAQAIKERYGIYPELNMDYGTPKNYFSNDKKHKFLE